MIASQLEKKLSKVFENTELSNEVRGLYRLLKKIEKGKKTFIVKAWMT